MSGAKYIPNVGWRWEVMPRQTRRHRSHNYADIGTYEVTVVVNGRRPVFGSVVGTADGGAELRPSPLGCLVLEQELPKIHALYPAAEVWQVALMPDHIHLILRISAPLPPGKHLGTIVGAFKGGITRAWRQLQEEAERGRSPGAQELRADARNTGADGADGDDGNGAGGHSPGAASPSSAPVSEASALEQCSLFEVGYNDRILMRDGQLDNWKRYLHDNPLRLWRRRQHPDLMRRALCVVIDGVRYGAFGNFALLRYPEKQQVFFHRRTDGRPTELTPFWLQEHDRLIALAQQGDVLVTPGISECEKRIKKEALASRYRLIHIQKDPISAFWKPERSRFDACAEGSLLILAPWQDDLNTVTDYATFHQLNAFAASICQISCTTDCRIMNANG